MAMMSGRGSVSVCGAIWSSLCNIADALPSSRKRLIAILIWTPPAGSAETCPLSLRNCMDVFLAFGRHNFCSIILLIKRKVINLCTVAH